jgi:hypothetical protein
MKITQTRLKKIIQEELAAVATEGSDHAQPALVPRTYNGEDITVKSVVADLFAAADKVKALGEDFYSDGKDLDFWIGKFMETHEVLKDGELEEGVDGPEHEQTHRLRNQSGKKTCPPDKDGKPVKPYLNGYLGRMVCP